MDAHGHPLDDVPRPLRPLVAGYARGGAALLHGYLRLLFRTCRIEIERGEVLASLPNYILCYWHTWAVPGFAVIARIQGERRFASLCHPAWHLLIWEDLGKKLGWRVVMGSSGHGGALAAHRITRWLEQGYSTFICPDGPRGPLHRPKRGALHMALAARVPIVPLRIECDRALRLPRWDRFCIPLPGATIRVSCEPAIRVTEETFEAAERALIEALG